MSKLTTEKDPYAAREAERYERPIPSREFILEYLDTHQQAVTYETLLEAFKLQDPERQEALARRLKAMLRDEQIERLKGGVLRSAGKRILVEGNIAVERGKFSKIWVIPHDGSHRILLSSQDARNVYSGNRVVVSVSDILGDKKYREGKLIDIIEQQRLVVTGRFVQEAGFSYVIPHGKIVAGNILIPQGKENAAEDGQIVVVELIKQPTRWGEPLGQVIEILGSENLSGIEIEVASRAYGLPYEWSESVQKEVQRFGLTLSQSAKRGRLDLRKLPFVTIDGEDAKDFDDAVFCEPKKNGGFKLYVAIADVSYYVRPNTALDTEAKARGNSVYFPGKVIPMLPEILSNELCSLKPGVDRLSMVCVMDINVSGKIVRYDFHESIIHSHARLTYTKVASLLEQTPNDSIQREQVTLLPHLKNLYALYRILRTARELRGAIDFETTETRIIFNNSGKISHIEPVHRNEAHRLIEECMLCANVACARFLKKFKLPGLYRNHEGPPADKLLDLMAFLKELGIALGGGQSPKPLDYAAVLHAIQDRADASIIQTVLLRSLSQAVYSKKNVGHFGLAYPAYTHFTSPIRRYSDLWVHRQIRSVLQGKWDQKAIKTSKTDAFQKALDSLGAHVSMTERRADDAVRDVVRWLKCQYIEKHIGDEFSGIISGVTRFGFFVELKDIYIDGLVHVTSLRNDYYYFDAIHQRLIGERSGFVYQLGDAVQVIISKVDVDERRIDFDLVNAALSERNPHKKAKAKKAVLAQRQKDSKRSGKSSRRKRKKK